MQPVADKKIQNGRQNSYHMALGCEFKMAVEALVTCYM